METIKNYLESMFKALPQTEEILRLKNELLSNMQEKYNELKLEGKTENEAIGIVISEFGNIDELLSEMDINITNADETLPAMNLDEVKNYISLKKGSSFLIGIGVALCISGAAVLILLSQLITDNIIFRSLSQNAQDSIPVISLFVFLVPAIVLFIYSGFTLEKYKFIDKGDFYISESTKAFVTKERADFSPSFKLAIIIGVSLCVLSPIVIIVGNIFGDNGSTYGVFFLLLMIAAAVFIFIRFGVQEEAYKKLIKIDEYSPIQRKNDKVIGAVASVVFPIATCIFLLWGFLFHGWSICWIVFPITGILFGAFSGAYTIIKGNK